MKILLQGKHFVWCFLIWINYFPKRFWKLSGEIVKNSFKVSRWLCWAILFWEVPVLQIFSHFQQKIFWLSKKIVPVKIAFYLFEWKCFWIYSLWKINSINLLRLRSESHRYFDWIFCAWLSKLPSKSLEEFCDDICFWSKELYKFFVLWHKTYRTFGGFFFQFRPNTLLSVDGNCLRMVFFDVFWLLYRLKTLS